MINMHVALKKNYDRDTISFVSVLYAFFSRAPH